MDLSTLMLLTMPFRHQTVLWRCCLTGTVMSGYSGVSQLLACLLGTWRSYKTAISLRFASDWKSFCLVHIDLICLARVNRAIYCVQQSARCFPGSLSKKLSMHIGSGIFAHEYHQLTSQDPSPLKPCKSIINSWGKFLTPTGRYNQCAT